MSPRRHKLSLLVALVALGLPAAAAAEATIPQLDTRVLRAIAVQHDGRYPPLDTAARDIVESITGTPRFRDRDPVLMLLAWSFDARTWAHERMIPIREPALRQALGLPADQPRFSYAELVSSKKLMALLDAHGRGGAKGDPLTRKVDELREKLIALQSALRGSAIRALPEAQDKEGEWAPLGAGATSHGHGEQHGHDAASKTKEGQAYAALRKAFLAGDAAAFTEASHALDSALLALPAAERPTSGKLRTELRYNDLQPFQLAWIILAIGAALGVAGLVLRRRLVDRLTIAALLTGFAVLSYGLLLRWQIAGRIPASNMFESLLFLSWGTGAAAIVGLIWSKNRALPVTAAVMGALSLALGTSLPLDHYVRPAPPVLLDTVWMSIHVPVIMVSYSVLALAVLVAHVQLVVHALLPARQELIGAIDGAHHRFVQVGALLLFAGIVTGSMWAASSWGRSWGWDPKEVWSLVALLAYLAILHVRLARERTPRWVYALGLLLGHAVLALIAMRLAPLSAGKLVALGTVGATAVLFLLARGRLADAVKSVLAFWMIIMTYLGVNYVLGTGLHSYGFGAGGVARAMLWVGGAELLFVALCCAVYGVRRRSGTWLQNGSAAR